ncbi:MAG: pantoate--beta-alanine ligase [Candidatus Nanopelagicaceae bacterium]|nr:pantoate--beta-alanine ligase [Candidatus Nanopelagicaceae bacterium]
MKVERSLTALNRPCAFVPTMGALHAGHQSLIKIAREYCDEVVVSVFVNPLQFEDKEDLAKYPKTPEIDERLAIEAGATILWRPEVGDLYPGSETKLSAGDLGRSFEGASRAGHFDGVLTVVNRLFELVKPKYAIFGEKDFQQLFLIKRMAAELHPEIEIIAAPTIREESGLALSSRNVRLSQAGLVTAQSISRALRAASTKESLAEMKLELARLENQPEFKLDYATIIDEESFELATENTVRPRALIAGCVDGVRLIDNAAMSRSLVKL